MIKKSKGFTLIELLVVVAIIGVLAAVVLGALNSGRDKAADSKIKTTLASMRGQAELYSGTGTAVTAVTPCPTTAGTLFETGNNGLGNLRNSLTGTVRCGSSLGQPNNGASWAVAAVTSTGTWCVDSLGVSRDRTSLGVLYTTAPISAIAAGGVSCL